MENPSPVKLTLSNLRNRAIYLRSSLLPTGYEDQIHWLFIATLPNSGSTALAQLLSSAPAATSLTSNGEGAWMIPALSGPFRSNPNLALDYDEIKAVWTNRIAKSAPKPCVVVEKSPCNLVRMKKLMDGFSPSPRTLVSLVRDPYAVCASWAKRYSRMNLRDAWVEPKEPLKEMSPDQELYWTMGTICGHRMQSMRELSDYVNVALSYEEIVADVPGVARKLKSACPTLEGIKSEIHVRVKDYAPQPLSNMNDRQIATLSDEQISWLTDGLRPYEEAVNAAGYTLRY